VADPVDRPFEPTDWDPDMPVYFDGDDDEE